ncbi:MAG: hypothetical protein IJ906_16550 [Oscillospiraceae bacterium]|nr:hypothetical protein [Oscillospiraceae bacterium]
MMDTQKKSAFLRWMCFLLPLLLAVSVILPGFARETGLRVSAASVD